MPRVKRIEAGNWNDQRTKKIGEKKRERGSGGEEEGERGGGIERERKRREREREKCIQQPTSSDVVSQTPNTLDSCNCKRRPMYITATWDINLG